MDIEKFKHNLKSASIKTVEFSLPRITNKLSSNFKYIIHPDTIEPRSDLNEWEESLRQNRIREVSTILNLNEAVDKLWYQSSVPTFIDISIYKSGGKETIFKLFTDSRYKRTEQDLYHNNEGYPPFHVLLDIPFYMDANDQTKFDINWRHHKWKLKYKIWKKRIELKRKNVR